MCVIGLAAAVLAVIRWGGPRVPPQPLLVVDTVSRPGDTVRRLLRQISLAVAGGALAGILVAGLGGRLVMRILAATSGDDVQGRLTEAEERVGEITLGGTIGLVIFVGIFGGAAGGLLYVLVRRWLPGSARSAGLLFGLLLLGLARLDPLDPKNIDFRILDPAWLAVTLVVVLFPLFGTVVASIIERLDRSWPLLERRPAALVAHLPLVLLGLTGPFGVVVLVAILMVLAVQRTDRGTRLFSGPGALLTGRLVLMLAGVAGLLWVSTGVADILEAA